MAYQPPKALINKKVNDPDTIPTAQKQIIYSKSELEQHSWLLPT
jgi:hypothetical protein